MRSSPSKSSAAHTITLPGRALSIHLTAQLSGLFGSPHLSGEDLAETLIQLAAHSQRASLPRPVSDFSPNGPRLADELIEAADGLVAQSQLEEAEILLRQGITAVKAAAGHDGTETLKTQSALARVLMSRGKYAEARRLFLTTVEVQRLLLGTRDLATLQTLEGLGELLAQQDETAHAEPLLREVIMLRTRAEGAHAPATLRAQVTLARLLASTKRHAEAVPLLAYLVERTRNSDDMAVRVYTQCAFGAVLKDIGRIADAEAHVRQAYSLAKDSLGAAHALTTAAEEQLAGILMAQGQVDDAEKMLCGLQEKLTRLGQSPYLLETKLMVRRGRALALTGEYKAAESLLIAGYERLRQGFGLLHTRTQRALSAVIALYEASGEKQKALSYRRVNAALS